MKLKKIFSGRALYTEADKIWVAAGMTFFAIDYSGRRVTNKFSVGSLKQRVLSAHRLSRQLLREGIHHLVPLANGDIFVTAKRKAYVVGSTGEIKNIFSGYTGNKPAHQGICVTPDGTLFFGEYSVNLDHKNATKLYRSRDNGMSFQPVLTFPQTVRHIHFVKFDPFEKRLWLGTGDADSECHLMSSSDNGDTWDLVGTGSQDWRAIGVCFTPDYIIWGTDAGSVPDQNHAVLMYRKTRKIRTIADIEGPCHGCAGLKDGRVLISTGVEGGANELDRFARLKALNEQRVETLKQMKKDVFPLIIQYGVMRFPLGTENSNKIVFTSMALKNGGENVWTAE